MKTRKLVTAAAVGAIGVVAFAAPAFAHVDVEPAEAPQGSTTTIALKIANETDATDTVKVDVKLPDDSPIASVTVELMEGGWTSQVVKRPGTDTVSEVIWTGGKIAPNEDAEFKMTLGPLPTDVTELAFPTIQTYSDGKEVAWIEPTPPSGEEPARPVPTLKLTAAQGGSTTAPTTTSPSTTASSTSTTTSSKPTTTVAPVATAAKKDDDSKAPLIIAVIVVLALLGGIGMYVRSRRV